MALLPPLVPGALGLLQSLCSVLHEEAAAESWHWPLRGERGRGS